jgi:hypothetical protein
MAEGRGVIRSLSSVLLLGGTALGLYNVYADNAEVLALAEKTACGDRPCTAKTTRESRSPLSQSFTFQTELTEKGKTHRGASVDVECKRAFYLLGAYSCVAQGVLP